MENKIKFFNIIDIIFFIVVVIGIIVVLQPKKTSAVIENKSIEFIFFAEETPSFIAENVQIGEKSENLDTSTLIGTITDISLEEGYLYKPDASGNINRVTKEGSSSIKITVKAEGQVIDTGVLINGFRYGVGHSFTIRAGDSEIYGRVAGLNY